VHTAQAEKVNQMTVFKRGRKSWYEFEFLGQRVREPANTTNKEVAIAVERSRRRAMEESAGGVKRIKPILFGKAAKKWLGLNPQWSASTLEINTLKLSHLTPIFGKLLLTEITPERIAQFQTKRLGERASNREVNMETAVLRMILRKHRLWHLIAPDFHPLPEPEDIGRALPLEEANRLLEAAINSRSRSLFPALMTYLHTGVRAAEARIRWKQVDFVDRTIQVGHSKTKGGQGRVVPLNDEAFDVLAEWHSRFTDPQPNHFVFPSERYGFNGNAGRLHGAVKVYALDPTKPMASMKTAWTACRKAAGVWCRLHDLRHTFISALGEAGVPESTMKAIAGWMSVKMLERYSHTRQQAKRDAVNKLPRRRPV
jgi:integrase